MSQQQHCPVVTIDGPSGSGKGTVSRRVAQRLGFHFLDSGALYRLTGLAAEQQDVALSDVTAMSRVALEMEATFAVTGIEPAVHLNGVEVTDEIVTERVGGMASRIAVVPEIRAALLERQRNFNREPGLVADGRDMGSIVFPGADVKIFLLASAGERALRRVKQLKERGIDANFNKILSDLEIRDERDRTRAIAPLVPAEGAVVVDSTMMSIDDVVDVVLNECFAEGLEAVL